MAPTIRCTITTQWRMRAKAKQKAAERKALETQIQAAVVEQSIERGWKGFFPINGSQPDAAAGIREWLHKSDAIEGEFSHDA